MKVLAPLPLFAARGFKDHLSVSGSATLNEHIRTDDRCPERRSAKSRHMHPEGLVLRRSLCPQGIVNLGNLLAVSPPRTTANLLICGPAVGRPRLKNRKGLPQLDNAFRILSRSLDCYGLWGQPNSHHEYFRFHGQTFSTVGLGALISKTTDNGNFPLLLGATVVMALLVVTVNRLLWRRLYRRGFYKIQVGNMSRNR